jgi:regulator of protease activity HflC (stomatin/prohibitin superfamily)
MTFQTPMPNIPIPRFRLGGLWPIALLAVGAAVVMGSWYTVDQGYRGVVTRNGAVIGMAEPGLGFKIPFVDSVKLISVQEHSRTYGSERGLSSYSRDQQPAEIRVSVNYQIPEGRVDEVYANFGTEESMVSRVLDPRVMQAVKNVFGQFNAVTAIQDRTRLNLEMRDALTKAMGDEPITITGLQVENIDFSKAYEESIEQRMQAEVEVQKLRQNAEREKVQAEITVTKAKADADSVRARAQAEADAIRLRGEAEAAAIKARSEALGQNPNLIALTQAEKWNGQLPSTMVPGGSVPFMNVGPPAVQGQTQ